MTRKKIFLLSSIVVLVFFSLLIWFVHPQYRVESKFLGYTTTCFDRVWREERFFIWELEYWSSSAREEYWENVKKSLDPIEIQQTSPSIEEEFEKMDDPTCAHLDLNLL